MSVEYDRAQRVWDTIDSVNELVDQAAADWWPTPVAECRSILSEALFLAWKRQLDERHVAELLAGQSPPRA